MIAAKLAQRRLIQLKKDFAQLLGRGITGGKALSVNLAQRADEGVAVLVADFAVVVAMAIVETGFAHAALHGARERQHPPAGTKWQSCAATGTSKPGSPAYADQRAFSGDGRLVAERNEGETIGNIEETDLRMSLGGVSRHRKLALQKEQG
jgi:hypothetical protein